MAAAVAMALAGCAPSLDWRDARTSHGDLLVLLPCKPERHARTVTVAQVRAEMETLSCTAAGTVWGVTSMNVATAQQAQPVVDALRAARIANLSGAAATPKADAAASGSARPLRIAGRMPDGTPVTDHFLAFADGSRVFQATALGGEPSQEALDTFFGGLRPVR